MHQKGFHPVSFYSPSVRSNYLNVHQGQYEGQLSMLLHDLYGHIFLCNRLNSEGTRFLHDYLVPNLAQLLGNNIYKQMQDETAFASLIDLNAHETIPSNSYEFYTLTYLKRSVQAAKENEVLAKFTTLLHNDGNFILENYKIDVYKLPELAQYKLSSGQPQTATSSDVPLNNPKSPK